MENRLKLKCYWFQKFVKEIIAMAAAEHENEHGILRYNVKT